MSAQESLEPRLSSVKIEQAASGPRPTVKVYEGADEDEVDRIATLALRVYHSVLDQVRS